MTYRHTQDQKRARDMLASDARHILLKGGARSGKTVTFLEAVAKRGLAAKESRHLITRYRTNALKAITGPTGSMNFVLGNAPGIGPEVAERSRFLAADGVLILPNNSEIWFGGLDDPKRVDKILGWEYATIYVNEASQVPWLSFTTALTRLAQVVSIDEVFGEGKLRQKCYVDCNPPPESHWIHRVFEEKRDPDTRRPLINPEDFNSMLMNPEGNRENLDPDYLEQLRNLPERQRKRFYLGMYGDAGEAALWTSELIDKMRVLDASTVPPFVRVLVMVDPSGADNVEDATSDEIGIGVVGLGTDGIAYFMEDLTMRGSPAQWGKVATDAYDRHDADCVIGESNFGGAMVKAVIQSAKPDVPYREVTATRGKHLRAEPVSAASEQGKVRLVGRFENLEDEMLAMTTAGYTGTKSPNRLDVLVWGVLSLFPKMLSQARAEAQQGFTGGVRIPLAGQPGGRGPTVNVSKRAGAWNRRGH